MLFDAKMMILFHALRPLLQKSVRKWRDFLKKVGSKQLSALRLLIATCVLPTFQKTTG